MPQKLPVNVFKWVGETSLLIKISWLHGIDSGLQFLPERMEIENFEKLVANLHNKNEYAIHTRNVKHGSIID